MFTNGSYKVLFKRGQFVERLPIVGQSAVSGRGAFLFLALPLHPPSKSMLFLYFCRMRRDRRALTKIGPRPSSVVRTQLEESCGLTRLVKSFVAVPPRRPYVEVMRFTSWSCFDIYGPTIVWNPSPILLVCCNQFPISFWIHVLGEEVVENKKCPISAIVFKGILRGYDHGMQCIYVLRNVRGILSDGRCHASFTFYGSFYNVWVADCWGIQRRFLPSVVLIPWFLLYIIRQ